MLKASLALVPFLGYALAQQAIYQQCGGIGWSGGTTCATGLTCQYLNDYYSQCLQSTSTSSSSTTSSTTTKVTATTTTTTVTTSTSSCPVASTTGTHSAIAVPSSIPTSAVTVDPALLSVSIEFFTFPDYMSLPQTSKCLSNLQTLRGAPPAVRIGGTTQDRATYDPSLAAAVSYTVASAADAPTSLTYGPSFFTLASQLSGDVTIGLDRELNNITNTGLAAAKAKSTITNLLAIELGNEPDLYSSSSPIAVANGNSWSQSIDSSSEVSWFSQLSSSVGNIFQAGVYLSWTISSLVSSLGSSSSYAKTFSRHAYPQSACGGASTDLQSLMSHSGIVSFASGYSSEAAAVHNINKRYFLGETNSATCGGGGISPTFGAALWVMDYSLQGALKGVERLYFHQGTISNCAYCFWGNGSVFAPYYGAYFLSDFLGSEGGTTGAGTKLAQLDSGSTSLGAYAIYSTTTNAPLRVLLYNSAYYTSSTRSSVFVDLSGLSSSLSSVKALRLSAPLATSLEADVTIGGSAKFDSSCSLSGAQTLESASACGGKTTVQVSASEAVIVYLS